MRSSSARGKRKRGGRLPRCRTVADAMEVKGIGKVAFVWGRLGEGSDFKGGYGLAKILRKHGEASVRSIPEVLTRGERDFTHPNRLVFVHDGYRATVTHGGDGGAGHWVLSNYRRDE